MKNDRYNRRFTGATTMDISGQIANKALLETPFSLAVDPANWPYSRDAAVATPTGTLVRPRAVTVIIRKYDGGEIGV